MGEGLLVILRGVVLNLGADPDDMISVRMWIYSHRVLTLRSPRLSDGLEKAYTRMKENGHTAVPVVRKERLIGLPSLDNIGECAMIQAALREGQPTVVRGGEAGLFHGR